MLRALSACGYREPTPIQEQAIPAALAGRDVLGCAQTGTGKTCAFGVPILQRLSAQQKKGRPIRALILTPTRELAIQIEESLEAYGANLPLRSMVIFGGVGQAPQVDELKSGVDILTATPGRLLDLHGQGLVDLSQVEIFVLDEADRMLDMGFIHDVRRILNLLPTEKQTLFFSATMPPEVTDLVNALLRDPVRVTVNPVSSPVEIIRQEVYMVDRGNKTKLLAFLLKEEKVKNALVFTRTKHGADKVARDLTRQGIAASAIHGNKSQTARQQALADFKEGGLQVLVATDIAARGLDIEELSHVFNYNLPEVPETYIHRIGRTGRAGHGGTAISFCDISEVPMLKGVEALLGKPIPKREGHPYPMEVFEAPPRDAKGRIINQEDQEARNAARERNAQRRAKSAEPPKPSVSGEKPGTKPAEQKTVRPKKQEKQEADTRRGTGKKAKENSSAPMLDSWRKGEEQTAPQGVVIPREDPLAGDVIMDATARLFAARPVYRFYKPEEKTGRPEKTKKGGKSTREAVSGRGQPPKEVGKEVRTETPSAREGEQKASVLAEKRKHRPRKKKPGGERPAESRTSPAVQEIERKQSVKNSADQAKKAFLNKGEGKGARRTRSGGPQADTRNHQKDSTEQPSLMKPYYIDHD